jgi:4'-phosphopantetheinyl transferase
MPPQLLPDPLPAGLAVFRLTLDLEAPLAHADWALLSADEGKRVARLHRHADRVRAVGTRAALRRLIGPRVSRRPQDLQFVVNGFGKPSLAGAAGPALHFNVSHAGTFALLAISEHAPVGVDIERRDPTLDVDGLVPLTLSALERQLPAHQRVDFFDCWTAKEAVLKALGLGVAEHLQSLSILAPEPGEGHGAAGYRLRHDGMPWPALAAQRLASPAGYASSLAWCVHA